MNYNREFLVPYLENICALYMADRKIQEGRDQSYATIRMLNRGYYSEAKPEDPHYMETITFLRISCMLFSAFVAIVLLANVFEYGLELSEWFEWLGLLGMIGLVSPGIIAFFSMRSDQKYNKYLDEKYIQELESVKAAKKSNQELREARLPGLNNEIAVWDGEHEKIRQLLNQAYDVNIIPSQYRNIYAAVYLYDYFKTSQSTDLERALTLFVLEEIKSRLDYIIQQQSEMILNQQLMIAEQRKTRELQEKHARSMRAKLDSIITSIEERNTYLDMIEANTRATAYFAAAEYLK